MPGGGPNPRVRPSTSPRLVLPLLPDLLVPPPAAIASPATVSAALSAAKTISFNL